jgi:hypothetical protein
MAAIGTDDALELSLVNDLRNIAIVAENIDAFCATRCPGWRGSRGSTGRARTAATGGPPKACKRRDDQEGEKT